MEKYNFAITALQQRLMALENAYEKYVENGNCNKNSAVAKQNRKNCKDVKEAINTLQASIEQSKLLLADVSVSFSLDFIKWYSGMEEQKILNAFERYKRESGNDR